MTAGTAAARLLKPLPRSPWPERWLTRLLLLGLSTAAYVLCMPWDLRNRPETPGSINETTPVTNLGVTILAVTLLVLGAYAGRRDRLPLAVLLVAAPPIVLLYASFASHPDPGGIFPWQLVWCFFSLVMAGAVLIAAAVGRTFREDDR
ncbi:MULTISPECIES: hypothetical protein [unclassified Streptomyces]|uniref:hypothetical protein n=1 Tax=unclassified Streptomyces TaxID=2593676 RepID=UPI002DDA8CDD|nr:hypothetical protein [Streptomyces sp. NBC_01445]WSE06981.1 hypothetical protein OG574_28795 [Streptomyces sp. NBC_01445]